MRGKRTGWAAMGVAALVSAAVAVPGGMAYSAAGSVSTPAVEVGGGPAQPGMCNGRTDPDMVLNAHRTGKQKFILNVSTDAAGLPSGALIVGRSPNRIYVEDFCRLWQHIPGQEPGGGHDPDHGSDGMLHESEGATIAHIVGTGQLPDGTRALVRADVRETEDGAYYRVRYRPMGQHHGDEGHENVTGDEAPDHEEWTWIPAEGWAALDMLKLRPADAMDS